MKLNEINIRDPFVLKTEEGYYLYGTRAADFGKRTGGFDVYCSAGLTDWSEPHMCFDSAAFGLNGDVNWAPEVHAYEGAYYMFATFTQANGLRGTYVLKADSPLGPFAPHSDGAVTPEGWECLDGTLYISRRGEPYLVFCHEHTQVIDGTICFIQLNSTLTRAVGEPKLIFRGSSPDWADRKPAGEHYITDGPFLFRSKGDALFLLWSTFIGGRYAQCVARSDNGEIDGTFLHLPVLIANDGGHGMIFQAEEGLTLTFHSPNQTGFERPVFQKITDLGNQIEVNRA